MDYVQRGARAGVRRFTPGRGRSIPIFPPFYSEKYHYWLKYPYYLLEDLHASAAFAWGISSRHVTLQYIVKILIFLIDADSGSLSFVDLSGAPQNELMAALSAPYFSSTYLVTPVPMYFMFPQGISSCMTLQESIFPHLDLDHIPESIQAGGHSALSLGIYVVEKSCIAV